MFTVRPKFDYTKTFFTSDWHFNHKNICRGTSVWDKGYRDFDSLEQMNATIINNFNEIVPFDGTVFMLGDVLFGDKTLLKNFLDRLTCRNIYLIYGNHDEHIIKNVESQLLFKACDHYAEIYMGHKLVVLSHYAMRIWNESHHGSYHLYAHSHGTLPDDLNSLSIDVGIDTNLFGHKMFYPYSFAEIDGIMRNHKKLVPVDHHNKKTNWS